MSRVRNDLSQCDRINEEGKQAASGCLELPFLVMSTEDVRLKDRVVYLDGLVKRSFHPMLSGCMLDLSLYP